MITFIIFNTVLYDGIGDFFHFLGIAKALLKNENFKGVNFIAFINFHADGTQKNFQYIERTLDEDLRQESGRIQVHFGKFPFHKALRTSPKLQSMLTKAKKGVIISSDGMWGCPSLVQCYADYCPSLKKTPFDFITEHEIFDPPQTSLNIGVNLYTLGLYNGLCKYTFTEDSYNIEIKDYHVYLKRNKEGGITYTFRDDDSQETGDLDIDEYVSDLDKIPEHIKKSILRTHVKEYMDYKVLYKRICGIKLTEVIRLVPQQAWEVIAQQDPVFANELLSSSNAANINEWMTINNIVPVYLNKIQHVMYFLCFLSNYAVFQKEDNTPKDVSIYLSGCRINSQEECMFLFSQLNRNGYDPKFDNNDISYINLTNDAVVITITCLNFSIRVFSGFYLSTQGYDAIYHLADVAVVSGDNTLENCVSMSILPFYWSTNHASSKWKTVLALQQITQLPELSLSEEVRNYFKDFFISSERSANIDKPFRYDRKIVFDFPKMIKEWPIVADYLRKNRNFYTQLENIIFNKLSSVDINLCKNPIDIEESILPNSMELLQDVDQDNLEEETSYTLPVSSNEPQEVALEKDSEQLHIKKSQDIPRECFNNIMDNNIQQPKHRKTSWCSSFFSYCFSNRRSSINNAETFAERPHK